MKVYKIILSIYSILFLYVVFCGKEGGIFSYVSEIMALSSVLLILGRFVCKREFGLPMNKIIPLLYMVLFAFIIFDYQYFTIYKESTMVYIKRYLFYLPIVFFSISTASIERIINYSKKYILIIAAVFVFKFPFQGINGSFLGTYQEVAGAISLGLLFYVADIVLDEKYTYKNVMSFLFLVATLLMTGKRTFAVIPIAILIVFMMIKSDELSGNVKAKRFLKILMPALLVGGIVLAIKPDIFSSILRLVETSQDDGMNGRKDYWTFAMYLWENNKWFGIGVGTFTDYIIENLDFTYQAFNVQTPGAAHNIYYQMLAEAGLIGFMLHLVFFSYVLFVTIKTAIRKDIKNNKQAKKCIYISMFIQIWFILYGFTGNPLYMVHQYYIYLFATMMIQSVKRKIRYQGNL